MLIRTVVILAFAASTAFAQTPPPDNTVAIAEATAMMDAGKTDDAIAKLKTVLASEPSNTTAQYELGLAWGQKGEAGRCRDLMQPLADRPGALQVKALVTLANCLDQLGDRKKAVSAYKRGLAIEPDDAELNFNLAVTLVQMGKGDEARAVGKHGATKNPWHASEHYLLAKVFEAQGFKVPAMLSYLHFLALEPTGNRSLDAATRLRELLGQGVEKTSKGYNINVDPNPPKDEGDFGAMQMMITLLAGGAAAEKTEQKKSEFENARGQIISVLAMYLEMDEKGPDNYTRTVQRPFFMAMQKEKVLDTFAGLALASLHLPGMTEWAKANEKSVDAYLEWVRPQTRPPAVAMPLTKQ
jgi:tetratricopeptide (TPR) repeat protein